MSRFSLDLELAKQNFCKRNYWPVHCSETQRFPRIPMKVPRSSRIVAAVATLSIWYHLIKESGWDILIVWILEDSMQLVDFMFKNHDQRLDFLQRCLPGIVTTWATTFAPTVTMVTFGSFLPVWQRDGILNLARQGPVWPQMNDSNDHFAASSTQSRYALLWQDTWIFRSRPQLGGSRTMVDFFLR